MARNAILKSISLRVEESVFDACKEIAASRHQSFNQFVQDVLARAARDARKERVRNAFAELANEDPDVEFAFAAQSEVVLGENPTTA